MMTSFAITKSYPQLVQDILNHKYVSSYGEGAVVATDQGRIKYVYPTTHNGVNEIECGSWSFGKRGLRAVISGDYDKLFENLKNNTKPQKFDTISVDFQKITGALPKDVA
jgi:hypothetical protein